MCDHYQLKNKELLFFTSNYLKFLPIHTTVYRNGEDK